MRRVIYLLIAVVFAVTTPLKANPDSDAIGRFIATVSYGQDLKSGEFRDVVDASVAAQFLGMAKCEARRTAVVTFVVWECYKVNGKQFGASFKVKNGKVLAVKLGEAHPIIPVGQP